MANFTEWVHMHGMEKVAAGKPPKGVAEIVWDFIKHTPRDTSRWIRSWGGAPVKPYNLGAGITGLSLGTLGLGAGGYGLGRLFSGKKPTYSDLGSSVVDWIKDNPGLTLGGAGLAGAAALGGLPALGGAALGGVGGYLLSDAIGMKDNPWIPTIGGALLGGIGGHMMFGGSKD